MDGQSRTQRFIGGLSLGYLHTVVLTLVGLWLTPYLLRHLGEHEYGLWLLGAQVLLYLGLMDLGVVALLPREVAYTTGRAGDDRSSELRELVGETARLVLWQTPAVALAGLVIWWLIPAEWSALRWPLAIVFLTFVLSFPLRIFHAVLQGLQDLPFLGKAQLIAWLVGTVVIVGFVQAGLGLYSLAAGWAVTQALAAALAWWRLKHRFPHAMPAGLPSLSLTTVRAHFGRGVWISVSQVAQVLLNGTDLFIIGKLLGPAAIVPYACTGKLITLLANQPQLFMQMAVPALSELRAGVSRERLFQVATGMSQVMLLVSGAIACVVLAVNQPFVTWWVGADRFGGIGLTGLLLVAMLLRHWNLTAGYTLFCFGRERRLAITGVGDGLVTLVAMLVLVPRFGLYGAVLGSLVGICTVSLPSNLHALAHEEGVSLIASIRPLKPWFVRFALVAGSVTAAISMWTAYGLWMFALTGALVGCLYLATMIPVLLSPPLGPVLATRLQPWMHFVPGPFRTAPGTKHQAVGTEP
jgi:O-antigen/teichoic acid export membrane protein